MFIRCSIVYVQNPHFSTAVPVIGPVTEAPPTPEGSKTVRFLVLESSIPGDTGEEVEEFKVEITNEDSTFNKLVNNFDNKS